jgi:chromate reductase
MSAHPVKILAIPGALRSDSWNRKLLDVASTMAGTAGASVTRIDLRDFAIPLYDGDAEAAHGLPDGVARLKDLFIAHDAVLIATPEYNASISGVLKNAIDWVTRSRPGERPLVALSGKVVGLLAATPGKLAAIRGLIATRHILSTLGSVVVPAQFGLAGAPSAFGPDGNLNAAADQAAVLAVVQDVLRIATALRAN